MNCTIKSQGRYGERWLESRWRWSRYDSSRNIRVGASRWPKDALSCQFSQRPLLGVSPHVFAVLSIEGKKLQKYHKKMKNIWAYVSVKHMVSICLFPAGYQHRNSIKHFNKWVKACYERKKKKPLTAHIFLFELKEPPRVKSRLYGRAMTHTHKHKKDMTSSYK